MGDRPARTRNKDSSMAILRGRPSRFHPRSPIPPFPRATCPCHDPVVFGHISTQCQGETQPNNSAPRTYNTPDVLTRINTNDLNGLSVTCGVITAEILSDL